MNDWKNPDHRKSGTVAFCTFLHDPANQAVRNQCTITSNTTNFAAAYEMAKRVFAQQGGFVREEDYAQGQAPKQAIPSAVEFRVYEELEMIPRDNLVTIVLPRPDQPLPIGQAFDVFAIYRCTWSPWSAHRLELELKND